MTRRGIPRLYSLPPTLPARTSPPLPSARRDEVFRCGARGQSGGVLWLKLAPGSGGRGRGEARRGLEDTAGDLLRAGWLAGAGGLDCALRRGLPKLHTPQPQRTWTDASGGHGILFTWAASRPRGLGWLPPGGRHLTPRDLGRRSRGAGRRWAPRRVLRPKRSSAPGFRVPSSLPTVVFRLAKYAHLQLGERL